MVLHFCSKLLMSEKLCPHYHKRLQLTVALKKSFKENIWVLWMVTKSTHMKCSCFQIPGVMANAKCAADGWFDGPSACRKPLFSILKGHIIHMGSTQPVSKYASTPVVLAEAALQKWRVPPSALLLTKTLALITRDIITELSPTAVYAALDVVLYPLRCLRFTFLSNRPAGLQEEDLNCCWISRQLFPIQ